MFNVFQTKEITKMKKNQNGIQTGKKPNLIIFQINSRTTLSGKN